VWAIVQDHVNGNLLFAGTEFGLFFTVDGGGHWTQLKGGMPTIQVRDLTIQKRENDLVLATFGRGFYVLDDYSALREINPQTLTDEARLFPLRDAYAFSQTGMAPAGTAGIGPMSGNWTTPNPPFGAVFTYNVGKDLPADTQLVLTINDDTGKQVRRLTLNKTAGLRRIAWNLRPDAPAPARTTDADVATSDDGASTVGFGLPSTVGFGLPSTVGSGLPSTVGSGLPSTVGSGFPSTVGSGLPSTVGSGFPSTVGSGLPSTVGSGLPSTVGSDLQAGTQAPPQGAGRGGQGAPGAGQPAAPGAAAQFGGGRGGQVPMVPAGRYQAVLGKMVGDKVTPIGPAQTFYVVQIPQ
jgi:hypothetical protein